MLRNKKTTLYPNTCIISSNSFQVRLERETEVAERQGI